MSKKTFLEVQQQIKDLQAEAERLRREESAEVLGRIKEAIGVYGFTAADLGFGKRQSASMSGKKPESTPRKTTKRSSVAVQAKYRDEAGNTWGGRGPRPAWFRAALEAGKTVEELSI